MEVPNFITHIPDQIDHYRMLAITKAEETKNWINDFAQTKFAEFTQTDFCNQYVKPIYEKYGYNFVPLTKDDYVLIQRVVMGAILLNAVTIKTFGIGALPLAAGTGTLMVVGVYYLMREKVHRHFNEIAWNQIDEIRKTAQTITRQDPKFAAIGKNRAYLTRKEFDRLEPDFKQLDEHIRIFREVVLAPQETDISDSKQELISYLAGLQNKLVVDKTIEPLS